MIKNFHPVLKSPLNKSSILDVVLMVFRREKKSINSISINMVRDRDLKRINRGFLDRDENTDIITFSYDEGKKSVDGEILISLDTVKRNGKYYGTGFRKEFKRVLVHGCLHLSGYDDRTKKQKELIRSRENFYLSN